MSAEEPMDPQQPPESTPSSPPTEADPPVDAAAAGGELEQKVIDVLKTCFDPEIPVNIYELGLIYDLGVDGDKVTVKMTLTSPMCPVAGTLPPEVQRKIQDLPEVTEARVDLVWEPPWEPSRMSEAAKLQLNMF
jgi:FeS assembly SUF system protein